MHAGYGPVQSETWVRSVIDTAKAESSERLCRALAPMLTEPNAARAWLARQLADLTRELPLLPAGFEDPVCQSVVMFDHDRVHLSMALISAEGWQAQHCDQQNAQGIIGFADGWTAIRWLSAPAATIQRYQLLRDGGEWRSWSEPPEGISPDRITYLDNAIQALRFVDVGADLIMLRLLVRDPHATHAIECDASSGAVLRVREAQSHDGRIRMILSLLRSLQRRDAVATVARIIATWPSHLRWHGVREALAIDSIAGFALLTAMSRTDPDPALRSLAQTTRDDLADRYPQLAA